MKINRYLSHWHLIQYFSYYFRLGDCKHASGDKKYRHMRYVSILVLSWTPSTKHWKGGGETHPLLLMATNISLNFWGPDKTVSEINEIDVKI